MDGFRETGPVFGLALPLHLHARTERRPPDAMQLLILLDNTRRETLTEQLVEQIRDAVRKGRIARGARLPSSRNLADQLGISRNTVVRAYENLILEGHIEARPASGVFVAEEPPPLAVTSSIASVAPSRPSATLPVVPVDLEFKRF